jgi:hypothetical protein
LLSAVSCGDLTATLSRRYGDLVAELLDAGCPDGCRVGRIAAGIDVRAK